MIANNIANARVLTEYGYVIACGSLRLPNATKLIYDDLDSICLNLP
jgi:hypothetical protein